MEEDLLNTSSEFSYERLFALKWLAATAATTSELLSVELDKGELEVVEGPEVRDSIADSNIFEPISEEMLYEIDGLGETNYRCTFASQTEMVCVLSAGTTYEMPGNSKVYPTLPADSPRSTSIENQSKSIIGYSPDTRFLPDFSDDVVSFCYQYNLFDSLQIAIEEITNCFPSVKEVGLQAEQDPEVEDEWLIINFTVSGDIDQILDAYEKYIDKWVKLVPWPERERIRLSYHII